jgi:hypothetical protein
VGHKICIIFWGVDLAIHASISISTFKWCLLNLMKEDEKNGGKGGKKQVKKNLSNNKKNSKKTTQQ